jgi:hypothetical protein
MPGKRGSYVVTIAQTPDTVSTEAASAIAAELERLAREYRQAGRLAARAATTVSKVAARSQEGS